jgi:hypothetical protein
LRPGGRYLIANPRLSDRLRALITNRFTRRRVVVAFAPETRAGLDALLELIEQGKIGPIGDRVEPMEQASEAHRRVEREERLGAIVLAIEDRLEARSRVRHAFAAAAITSALFAGGLAFAAEEPSTQKDLEEFACKDVMRLSGNQREYTLAFVHATGSVR